MNSPVPLPRQIIALTLLALSVSVAGAQTRIISLSGNMSFGNVKVGLIAQQALTIANSGNASLTVSNVVCPAGFTASWSGAIPSGQATNVTVTFTPVAETNYSGLITVIANATSGTNSRAVSGTGTPAHTRIIVLGGSLSFDDVPINYSSARTLTISNAGDSTLTISNISYPGGFAGNWSGAILPANTANVPVTFAPTATTLYGGSLTVSCDANSGTRTRALSGTGVPSRPTLTTQRSGNYIVMSWPTNNVSGFDLEYNYNPTNGGTWTPAAGAPKVINGKYVYSNYFSAKGQAFRLKN